MKCEKSSYKVVQLSRDAKMEKTRYEKSNESITEELKKLERKVPDSILESKHRNRPVTADLL
eukprot:scaffold185462_cov54-Attheya_sp.AAC.2